MVSPISLKGLERSPQVVDLDEILAEAMQATAASIAACTSVAAFQKASAERTRWIKLAPLVNPRWWTGARLAELFGLAPSVIAEAQQDARLKTEHASYLLGRLIGMVVTHCEPAREQGGALEAAEAILAGADITVQGIRAMFEGCHRAASRDMGAGQRARQQSLDAWFGCVRRCPMQEAFEHDQLRALLLGSIMFWGLESEYGLRLEMDSTIMIRLGLQDEMSSWSVANDMSR